jgi:hypothetical protein
MPSNLVHTKDQERHWQHAKQRVQEQYPEVGEDSDRHWALVTSIYKKMSGLRKNLMHDMHPDLQQAIVDRTCAKCQDLPLGAKVDYLRKIVQRYRECEHAQALQKARPTGQRRYRLVLCVPLSVKG